ncbi:hypothetical protein MHUMG1_01184 [Metarhizium humberi]|uniref:Uncharacterized protein n=1 Tax=Metarhizium humberi TaxID=2596975 RepID=A0A9P8MGW7_9HYPO|nr:hypothetical protein MHUMG1_01184 [Metarhizium humberi]
MMFKVKAPCTKRAHQTAQMVVKLGARREREDPGEEWRCPRRKEDEDWKANWRALREGGGGVINNGFLAGNTLTGCGRLDLVDSSLQPGRPEAFDQVEWMGGQLVQRSHAAMCGGRVAEF